MKPWKCLFECAESVCLKSVNVFIWKFEYVYLNTEKVLNLPFPFLNCFDWLHFICSLSHNAMLISFIELWGLLSLLTVPCLMNVIH